MRLFPQLLALGLLNLSFVANADDWPNWRGPDYNGISSETDWQADWPDADPELIWEAEVGIGFATVSVADGRVFTTGNENDEDTIWCLDALTGEVKWKRSYDEPLDPKYYEGGTSATPTVDGDVVYSLSRRGKLFALDVKSGEALWDTDVRESTKSALPDWGFAGSPFVHEQLLVLNVGGSGLALDKATGKQVWFSDAGKAGYSTPYPYEVNGEQLAVFSSARDWVARKLSDGSEVWRFKWLTRYGVNASDPIIVGEKAFVSSGYGKGCGLVNLASGGAEQIYANKEMETQMNPCVELDGFLFGCSGGEDKRASTLRCMEMATGEVKWTYPGVGTGSVTSANGYLIVLSARGVLMTAKVSSETFEPLLETQVLGGKCWTVPVLANGLLYCRNAAGDLVCVDLRPSS